MAIRDEILAANSRFAERFSWGGLPGRPTRRFAVVTCMDARLDPASFLGLEPGDAHVLRNAGAVVSDDVLRALVVGHWLLGTEEALVVAHTDCGMAKFRNEELRERLAQAGVDAAGVDFGPFPDVETNVRTGVARIRESPLLPSTYGVSGWIYDVRTGRLNPV